MVSIAFYTPDHTPLGDFFGCASFGMTGVANVYGDALKRFEIQPQGIVISGTYEECLLEVQAHAQKDRIQAAIVLFGNTGGENNFLHQLSSILYCPVVGGGAAVNLKKNSAGLIRKGGEANILLLSDDRFDVEITSKNIHDDVLSAHSLKLADARTLLQIDGVDAADWLAQQKIRHGLAETDFEHITFSDEYSVNAHLSLQDGAIKSGRDLAPVMTLRRIEPAAVFESVRSFYDDENAIVFGCAGLLGLLECEIQTKALGLFLFGEVCYADGRAEFGNLMLSKIKFIKKNRGLKTGENS